MDFHRKAGSLRHHLTSEVLSYKKNLRHGGYLDVSAARQADHMCHKCLRNLLPGNPGPNSSVGALVKSADSR